MKTKKQLFNELQKQGLKTEGENIAIINEFLSQYGYNVATIDGANIHKVSRAEKANGVYYECCCWFWVKDGNYSKYLSQDTTHLMLKEEKPENTLKNILNSANVKNSFARRFNSLGSGWTFEEMPNSKPATLQARAEQLENNNILYFAFYNGNRWILCGWDTNSKKATGAGSFSLWGVVSYASRLADANEARTHAIKTMLLYADKKPGQEAREKHIQRQQNKPTTTAKRYSENEQKENYSLCGNYPFYAVGRVLDVCIPENQRIFPTSEAEKDSAIRAGLALAFDKSGYFVLNKRLEIQARAQRRKAEKLADIWKNTDKGEKIAELEKLKNYCVIQFEKIATSKNFDFYTLHRLSDIAEIVKDTEHAINNINEFKSCATFAEKLEHLKDKVIILKILLTQSPSDPLAYGFSWWHLNEFKNKITCDRNFSKDYYKEITARGETVKNEI